MVLLALSGIIGIPGIIGITFHLYHQLRPIEVFFVFLQRYL